MISTNYRYIEDTEKIPYQEDLELIAKLDKLEPKSSHRNLPIVWNAVQNYSIFDRHNNKYIDFTSGIFVTNTGHRNHLLNFDTPLMLHSYTFPTEIKLKFLEFLIKFTGFEKAVIMNTGTEAVETAIKIIRLSNENDSRNILSFRGSMHGKSQLTLNLRDNNLDLKWISQDPNIYYLNNPFDFPDDQISFNYKPKDIAGIIIESYRGWDAQFFDKQYIQELVTWAKSNKILVCFDEIQSGFGRTGKLFAFEHYDLSPENKPDLVCIGKALGNGIPISAVLSSSEIIDKADFVTGDFSTTYGGNPLSCNLALANLEFFESNNLIKESERKGKMLEKILSLSKYEIVDRINTKGLVGAIVFKNKEIADSICLECLKNGLILVNTGKESVKIGPPLTIDDEALIEGINVIEKAILDEIYKCWEGNAT